MPNEEMRAARLRAIEWLAVAVRMAEEVDREIEANGTGIDIWWIQDKARDIAWHCQGALGDPGPRPPAVNRPEDDRPGESPK